VNINASKLMGLLGGISFHPAPEREDIVPLKILTVKEIKRVCWICSSDSDFIGAITSAERIPVLRHFQPR
jgi:hypothetical protein